MDAERKERLARNEAVFREVNERIEKLTRDEEWLGQSESLEGLCECGNRDCSELLKLSISHYERVRQGPTHFLAVPGPLIPENQEVIATGRSYQVAPTVA